MIKEKIDISKNFANTGKDIYLLDEDYALAEEVKNILSTSFRSKFLDIYFGTDIQSYMFEVPSNPIIIIIKKILRETIISYCPDVRDVKSLIQINDDELFIKLLLVTKRKSIETETRFYLR